MSNKRKVKGRDLGRAAAPPPTRTSRRIVWTEPTLPGDVPVVLCLLENDGALVRRYGCERSWARMEHDGCWWRLNGRDADTGEFIYLREVA